MVELNKSLKCGIQSPEEVADFLRKSPSWVYKHWQELGAAESSGVLCSSSIRRTSMSVYFTRSKGWRYDLPFNGTRYTKAGFKTKKAAREAKAKIWKELINPSYTPQAEIIATAITFLDLVNMRLDYVKACNSETHYLSYKYLARSWVKKWGDLMCSEITPAMVQQHLLERRKISAYTANKDLRNFRATFNFGIKKKYISNNPTEGIEFFPVEKKIK